jgi:hypothetical protein
VAKRKQPDVRHTDSETQHADLLRIAQSDRVIVVTEQRESLAQPSFLKVVETVTTYGAYEQPI